MVELYKAFSTRSGFQPAGSWPDGRDHNLELFNISGSVRIFPFHTCIRQWEAELCLRTNREAYSKKCHSHHVDIM